MILRNVQVHCSFCRRRLRLDLTFYGNRAEFVCACKEGGTKYDDDTKRWIDVRQVVLREELQP